MNKSQIIAEITAQSISVGEVRCTGSGDLTDILRYNVTATKVDANQKVYDTEVGFYVYKEGTVDENAYYVYQEETPEEIKTFDNKLLVQSTSRPIGMFTCFSSEGDSTASPIAIGDGQKMTINHAIGQDLEQSVYVDLNVKENRTFLSEWYVIWKNCELDTIKFSIVPKVTPYTPSSDTNFNLYGGFLIIPAAGDGSIAVETSDIQLIEIPFSLDDPTQRQSAGYWDASYDTVTHTYSNIAPNVNGTGQYNMFGAEISFEKIADIVLLSSNCMAMHSSDVAELGSGMRLKFDFYTEAPDHNWQCVISLTLNRKYSI
jgi:hypothetical protein